MQEKEQFKECNPNMEERQFLLTLFHPQCPPY